MGGPEQCFSEGAEASLSQSDCIHYADIWAQREGSELFPPGPKDIHCNEANEMSEQSISENERIISVDSQSDSNARNSFSAYGSKDSGLFDDYENEIRQELRWLKAKYQMQLREVRDQQLGVKPKHPSFKQSLNDLENENDNKGSMFTISTFPNGEKSEPRLKFSGKHLSTYFPPAAGKKCASFTSLGVQNSETINTSYNPETVARAKSFYTGALLPHPLHRASSLPVDAVDV